MHGPPSGRQHHKLQKSYLSTTRFVLFVTTEQRQQCEAKYYLLVPLVSFSQHLDAMQMLIHSVNTSHVSIVVHDSLRFLDNITLSINLGSNTFPDECLIKMTCTIFGFPAVLSLVPLHFIANMFSCSLKTADPFCISLLP